MRSPPIHGWMPGCGARAGMPARSTSASATTRSSSRAPSAPCYVQDRLRAAAADLRDWVDRGASVLVCGNAVGMAHGVDAALAEVLGTELREALRAEGRYRLMPGISLIEVKIHIATRSHDHIMSHAG